MKRWKRRRDITVAPAKGARPRTLPQYHRETAALLIAGHRFHHAKAVRALGRWRGFIRESWKRGKPPCWTSDHVAKYERTGESPMSGGLRRDVGKRGKKNGGKAVLIQRGRVVGRFSSRGKAILAGKSLVRRTGRMAFVVSRNASTGRDSPGDVYESRAGNRWEVISLTESGKVKVRRTPHLKTSGELIWSKGVLGSMKKVGHEKVPEKALESPKEKGFFGGLLAPDPAGRPRRARSSRMRRRWRRRSRR